MGFFYFLKKKKFYLHLATSILLSVGLLFLVIGMLKSYTHHGDVFILPDFAGQTTLQLKENRFDEQFDFILIDSVYDDKKPKGTIISQNPLPGSKVKQGRNVYLTIIALQPEQVEMPNLMNLSLRQAMVMLQSSGLPLQRLTYTDHFARNAVLEQLIAGEPVEPGTLINKGSKVELVLGLGATNEKALVPMLIGQQRDDAITQLQLAGLNAGKEYFIDGNDTSDMRVFKSEPMGLEKERLEPGSEIDLWFRSAELFDFDSYLEELTRQDTLEETTKEIPMDL